MLDAANGAEIRRLWEGDTSAYKSQSEADQALCNHLAFWCQGDTARMDALFRQSGLCRDKWTDREDYRTRTLEKAKEQCHYYDPNYGKPQKERTQTASNGTAPATLATRTLPLSDYTNAEAFTRRHGADLRYCYPWRKWLHWTGTHWTPDDSGAVMQRARQTVKQLAARVEQLTDDHEARAWLKHVKTSLGTGRLKAMIEQAQCNIPVQPTALDASPWLLGCANGTLDLRSGTLQPHERADLLTKILPVAYDPQALCPTWSAFLWRVMGGSVGPDDPDMSAAELTARTQADNKARELIDFLRRAVGYSLTGDTREECLFILYGTGQNGKSRFLGALQDLLGPYAQATHSKTFMQTDRSDGIPNDLARLRGARLVTAIELGKGRRLNEELIKRVTGRDPVTARFLYGEFFDYLPQFKLFLACNDLSNVRSVDKAMWRRLYQVPFTVTIPDAEKDKALGDKLRGELPGILAWAVRGCLEWQKNGLKPPAAVVEATEEYRTDMDVIGRFIKEVCVVLPAAQARTGALYKEYTNWCNANGEHAESLTLFGKYLESNGFDKFRSGGIWRKGIGLPAKSETDGTDGTVGTQNTGKSY